MTSKIIHCYFENIIKEGSGGAINIQRDDDNVIIKNCFFMNNSATEHGGSFLLDVKTSNLKNNMFIECFSSKKTDNYFGNAGVFNSGKAIIEHATTYKCGPSDTKCSDSAIKCNCPADAKYINATKNHGVSGASSFSITIDINDSLVKFLNVVEPYDNAAIECRNDIDVFYSNFINTTSARYYILYASKGKYKFNTCFFINAKSPFANRNGCWEATDCQSDISIASMDLTTPKALVFLVLFNKFACTMQHNNYRNKSIVKMIFFIIIAYS